MPGNNPPLAPPNHRFHLPEPSTQFDRKFPRERPPWSSPGRTRLWWWSGASAEETAGGRRGSSRASTPPPWRRRTRWPPWCPIRASKSNPRCRSAGAWRAWGVSRRSVVTSFGRRELTQTGLLLLSRFSCIILGNGKFSQKLSRWPLRSEKKK